MELISLDIDYLSHPLSSQHMVLNSLLFACALENHARQLVHEEGWSITDTSRSDLPSYISSDQQHAGTSERGRSSRPMVVRTGRRQDNREGVSENIARSLDSAMTVIRA